MYIYQQADQTLVNERVQQFREQTARYLDNQLTEAQFLPLRLQNGLYIQRFAPMLRIAIPYGMLNTTQLRKLAEISRRYDKGYVHFTTRQNVQLNWPELPAVPDILAELAEVQMHAIQTSGNCIRNTTCDQFAGVAADELVDPRPWCELIRQWSTLHPEFAYLPRKFKIAVSGAKQDRAAIQVHDIGLHAHYSESGDVGFRVYVGGGLGRTPVVGSLIRDFLPAAELLSYLEAVLRIYNRFGRRDNKYKARIKILVQAMGVEAFTEKVEQEWQQTRKGMPAIEDKISAITGRFTVPPYETGLPADNQTFVSHCQLNPAFRTWAEQNVMPHRIPGYASVTITLKATGYVPGDASAEQLELVADLADRFSFGEIRTTHEQNLVLADVRQGDLQELWQVLQAANLATPNLGLLTDLICCPGGDYCALANAKSIPVANALQQHFDDLDYLHDLGPLSLNISGCMNACGHHHVGHIGILGVDKKGEEFYQIQLGGNAAGPARLGKIVGRAVARDGVISAVDNILKLYLQQRAPDESFLECYQRLGLTPFKEAVRKAKKKETKRRKEQTGVKKKENQ